MAFEKASGWPSEDSELEGLVSDKELEFVRSMPLRRLWQGQVLRVACKECNSEREEVVRNLVKEGRLGMRSINELEQGMTCRRPSCGGKIQIDLEPEA